MRSQRPSGNGLNLSPDEERQLGAAFARLKACTLCGAPAHAHAAYRSHGHTRLLAYAVCVDCFAEVSDPATSKAAGEAIERLLRPIAEFPGTIVTTPQGQFIATTPPSQGASDAG